MVGVITIIIREIQGPLLKNIASNENKPGHIKLMSSEVCMGRDTKSIVS